MRQAVDAALGPDDQGGGDPRVRYFRLRSPILSNPWYVRILFDDEGKVVGFLVSVD